MRDSNLVYTKYYYDEPNPTLVAVKLVFESLFYIIVISLLVTMVLGARIYVVVGWSMQPTIDYMSIVFVVGDTDDVYQVDDIITFEMGGAVNTHRIIEVVYNVEGDSTSGVLYYHTKGDNPNIQTLIDAGTGEVIEEQIIPSRVIGKVLTIGNVVATIPGVGDFILFCQKYIVAVILSLIGGYLVLISLPNAIKYKQYYPN